MDVDENTTAVATLTATDADAGTTLTYSVSGGRDMSKFTVDGNTGALAFKVANTPNFESPGSNATPAGTNYRYSYCYR